VHIPAPWFAYGYGISGLSKSGSHHLGGKVKGGHSTDVEGLQHLPWGETKKKGPLVGQQGHGTHDSSVDP